MHANDIEKVSIIGAGIMGLGIGVEFARFGYDVNIYDVRADALKKAIGEARDDLKVMVEANLIESVKADAALSRIHPVDDFKKCVENSQYVLEAVPEVLSVKQEVFGRLGSICSPQVILASTTSSLSVIDISAKVSHPERVIVTHYYSPPHFMPLVEVFPGPDTSSLVIETVTRLMKRLRKKAMVFDNSRPRILIGNRLQSAIAREAQALFDEGISAEEIDSTITYGFGRRMPFAGYFQRMDMVGLDGRMERYAAMGHSPWSPITQRVARGELGVKTGRGFHEWPGDSGRRLDTRMKTDLARILKHDMDNEMI